MERLLIILLIALNCTALFAQATNNFAPGAPGKDAHWPTAAKNGFGTANTTTSKIWFTLADGVMTEVYYPTIDKPNTQMLQLVVVTGDRKSVDTEEQDTTRRLRLPDSRALTFQQVNHSRNGDYIITKTYATDPERPTVLIDVQFESRNHQPYFVYVYYDPSLNNSGMHDTAWTKGDALLSLDGDKASALVVTGGFAELSNGYLGTSDGLEQLRHTGRIEHAYEQATNGNVVQVARVNTESRFTIALGFGQTASEALSNARASLAKGFSRTRSEYEAGWHQYAARFPRVGTKYQKQFDMSAMVLKALEDKSHPGAIIASPSTPWGGGPNANEPTISGYHAIWSRDLYQIATAFDAMGDRAGAIRALDYLFKVQQKPDGSFPQNTWVDGRAIGGGLQMDQVAFPIILAYQLRSTDRERWLKHIKPAADFIARSGPATGQDRWEEKPGYSPATIAAEIAALTCASRIATTYGDKSAAAAYLQKADEWTRKVERWTATTNGPYGDGRYYLRISENDDPNDGAKIEINSNGGSYDEREIVDAGFLELVRLGIKSADDPLIRKSLAVVDKLVRVETHFGSGWYRYNHDAYGERADGGPYDGRNGVGRLWTLLTGERGEYDLARGDHAAARKRLDALMGFANDGRMIPEQVWDRGQPGIRLGAGTGSATPLAWSMAQFIRLAINLQQGRNIETPRIVAARDIRKGSRRKK